eukprot:SAG11_NODE_180_length_13278_cov_9.158434_6_plen_85_part_00
MHLARPILNHVVLGVVLTQERTQKFFMVRNTLRAAKAAVARGDLAGMQPEVQSGPNQDLVAGFAAKSIAAVRGPCQALEAACVP